MSYRLIDANALATMPCIYADLPNGLDGNHYIIEQSESDRESRWHELFGTPERVARMLEESCHLLYDLRIDGWVSCAGCPVFTKDADVDDCCYSKLLEWLRGDA